jgi:hypothetical protein
MAMSLSLVGLKINNLTIKDADCVCKTFPTFFDIFLNFFNGKYNLDLYKSKLFIEQNKLFIKNIGGEK